MSIAQEPVVTDRTATQRLFGLGAPTRDVDDRGEPLNRMSMDIGALAPNTARTAYGGVLAVLLDDLLGFTVWDRRGTRDGLVSAELSVDVVTPRRWQGPTLRAESRLLALTADGGTSTARVHDSAGTLIATGPLVANKLGFMHGGVQGCAMDLAANAALSRAGADMDTASVRINYFRPIPLDRDTTFTADVVRAGRSVAVARVAGTSGGRICVEATVTGRRRLS
nr:PaaI family thioesterase [Rhodococcus wratislaviensis]GLK37255.1 hypothetical protein GCM10017611_41170 [Rhodococcus wratislaviensis]